jgi:ABC-type transporter Mla MlaB component
MLKISTHIDGSRTVFELEGRLTGPWVLELKDCWQRAVSGGQQIMVVMKQVSYVDSAGKILLAEMFRQGADLTADGCMTTAIIEEIKRGERR